MNRLLLAIIALVVGSVIAFAQVFNPTAPNAPGGSSTQLQFNTNSVFGGISSVTSDGASIGFTTSSNLILYGFTVGDCVKVGTANALADSGGACGGSASIAAGTNITTSGTAANTTINVVATPSFTTVIASGNVTAGTAQFTGAASGTTAQFQTVTVTNLTPTGPNCLQETGGVLQATNAACASPVATSIAAGTDITTSGTASNITVNVVATPSFTTVIASGNLTAATAQFAGFLTAGGASLSGLTIATETLSGNLTGTTASFSGNLTGTTAQFTGLLTGTNAVFQTVTVSNLTPTGPNCLQETGGVLQATNAACASPTSTSIAAGTNITTSGTATNITINVVATPSFTTVIATGNLTAGGAQFTSQVTGTSAVFQTATISNLTPTGPNCLQETGGVLQATNVSCATQVATISIAAGNNITTSGTTSNITVTATPTGASNTVQFNNAGVFGGDSGFQYAGGTSGIVTHTLGSVTTTNARALSLIGTLSSSTVQFDAPMFMNITTSAFAVGSKLVDVQASGLPVFGVSPSGSLSSAALSSAAAQCLQSSISGTIIGFGSPCATQVSTPSIAAGTNITTSGTAANTTVNVVATPSFTSVIATGNLTGNIAQFAGFMSAGGASLSGLTIQTATFSSNLTGTTANFSSNLTANIAQFAGFLSAGGASLSGLTIQTATLSGALNGATAVFTGTLTGANASFTGDITATRGQFTTVTGQSFATQTAGLVPSPLSVGAGQAFLRADGTWATPATLALAASTVTAPLGWINYNGTTRTLVDVGFSTTTVPVNLMTINVNAGRTYRLEAQMPLRMQASSATIGFRVAGTATTTTTVYDGWVIDSSVAGIKGNQQATALSTTVAGTVLSGTTGHATVIGTVSVNAAGTLILQGLAFATGTSATTTTVSRGATFILQDMP